MLSLARRERRQVGVALWRLVDASRGQYAIEPGEVDLLALTDDVMASALTTEAASLREAGVDPWDFYDEELAPNWEGLGPGARAAKLRQFARLINGPSVAALDGLGIVDRLRLKTLLLAWAYDLAYGGEYVKRTFPHAKSALSGRA